MDMQQHLKRIAEAYFKLNHIPFDIYIRELWLFNPEDYSYYDCDVTNLSLDFLESLVANTDKYIKLCNSDGGYLFNLDFSGYNCKMPVEVKLKN